MIKTVGQLRAAIEDAPDDMRLSIQMPGVSRYMQASKVMWMDLRCILVVRDTLQPTFGRRKTDERQGPNKKGREEGR